MRTTFTACINCLALLAGAAYGQWSEPIPVSANDQANMHPAAAGIGEHGLWAAWLEQHDLYSVVKGSYYDGGNWGPVQELSPQTLITVGPALVQDSAHTGVLLSYYLGSSPTDEDTWGIYTVTMDSSGPCPPRRACLAPSLGIVELRMAANGFGQAGIIYETGSMVGIPEYIEFISRRDSTWSDSLLVASGWEYPPSYFKVVGEPRIVGGRGDTFFLANWTYVNNQGSISSTVSVATVPPDTVIGSFGGDTPELAFSPGDGRLWLAFRAATPADTGMGVRSYTRSGGWSDLQILDRTAAPASLAADPSGYVWLAYVTGSHANQTILARYAWAGGWSEPETVAVDSTAANPVIASDNSGRVWVLWARTLDASRSQVLAAYRELRPGIASGGRDWLPSAEFAVAPNPSSGRVVIRVQLASDRSRPVLGIYDRSGRLVWPLAIPHSALGTTHYLTWDCRDMTGARVPDGCYFVMVGNGAGGGCKKLVVTK